MVRADETVYTKIYKLLAKICDRDSPLELSQAMELLRENIPEEEWKELERELMYE